MFDEEKERKFPLKLNLQMFASGEGENNADDGDDGEDEEKEEKKLEYTQKELNALLKKNKMKSRNALLKQLGFDGENAFEELQNALAGSKKKTEQDTEEVETLRNNFSESEKKVSKLAARNQVLEAQMVAIKAGVKPEAVDDVTSIAMAKVDDDTDFEDVINDMKKNSLYASFFTVNDTDVDDEDEGLKKRGTGNPAGNKKQKGKNQTYAERMMEQRKSKNENTKRESFFKN